MRVIFGLVLLVGVALAGGAVYMAKDYIGQYQAELARAKQLENAIVPTQSVFVAAKKLRYGDILKPEDVKEVKWPVNAIPEGSFTDMAVLFYTSIFHFDYLSVYIYFHYSLYFLSQFSSPS